MHLNPGLLPYCYNQDWMKNGWLIPWNAIAVCEMFKTSWQMGRHLMKGASENHLKARSFRSMRWLNTIRCSARDLLGHSNTDELKLHVATMPALHEDLRATRTGLALSYTWSDLTLETGSHPWVLAGHTQYTGHIHHDGKHHITSHHMLYMARNQFN